MCKGPSRAAEGYPRAPGKLLDVYYSDSLPRDVFLKEQRKLNNDFGKVRRELQSYDEDD